MCRARLALFLLLLFSFSPIGAVEAPFRITPDSPPRWIDLGPGEVVFEDAGGRLTLDDVRALPPDRFVPLRSLGKLNLESAYWVRVDVASVLPLDMQYVPTADWWDALDIHAIRTDGSVTTLRTGLLKKPEGANDRFFPIILLRAGESLTFYARFSSTGKFRLPHAPVLYLSQAAPLFERMQPFDYFQAIVVGMLFALAIYNLVIATSTRDAAYLMYGLYLLALSISLIGTMSPFASKLNQLFLPGHPVVAMWLKRLSDPAAWILLLLFDRAFLETRRYLPRWDKALLFMIALELLSQVIFLLGLDDGRRTLLAWISDAPEHVIALLAIAAGVLRYRQGFVAARYFVAAQAMLSIGMLLMLYRDAPWNPLTLLPSGAFWSYVRSEPLWVGAAAEAIIFSMGLAYRMNMLKAQVAEQTLSAERERKRLAVESADRLEVEVAQRTQELRREKENVSHLLHNILPVQVADELIANGSTQPKRYDEVTILFTDFKGFTNTVSSLPAKKVVAELNDIFQNFDDIIDACGLEKIKTVGDSYMIAGGVPNELPDHAMRCVDAALRMQRYLAERNQTSAVKWNMRAGIHSGAVIAGVVGKRKFTYDIWGDTVNIASRMESAGDVGRVNLSAYAYDLVKSRYKGEYRGKLEAKGKGEIDMYFVVA